MKTSITLISLSTIFVCLAASAQTQQRAAGGGLAQRFKQLDGNGDGRLSRDEIPQLFDRLDANKDGAVTMDEIGARLGQGATARRATPAIPENASFVQTEHKLTVDGRERTYIIQSPKQPKGKLPVVFFFHGGGGRGANMAAAGFQDMITQEQFLAVYPDGWRGNWNDGRQAARITAQVEGVDDVKFVRAMVDDLVTRHAIDRSRVFATGASNGGIFSHYLAAKAADLIAGIVPVIGGLAEPVAPTFKPSHPISLLVIQGEADLLVPIGGGAIANSDRGGRVIATEAMLKQYLAHNGITAAPQIEQLPDLDPNDGTGPVPLSDNKAFTDLQFTRDWIPGTKDRNGRIMSVGRVNGDAYLAVDITPDTPKNGGLFRRVDGPQTRDILAPEELWNFFALAIPENR